MRILFSSLASHGHIYPLIPLSRAALDAGHEVIWATDELFLPNLRNAGFQTVPVGLTMYAGFAELVRLRPELREAERGAMAPYIGEVFGGIMPRAFARDLLPAIEQLKPDLVVHEMGNRGAGIAAKAAGVPGLCHGFGRNDRGEMGAKMDAPLHAVAEEFGVTLPSQLEWGLGDRFVDICPPSLQTAEFLELDIRIPMRPVAFSDPGELPSVVSATRQRPLIYLTLGTAFGNVEVLRTAINGLSALDADVLVAIGPSLEGQEFPDLPANVTTAAWVPQAELLPHTDLVVHHGGSGTTLGALAAGVPQLFLPQGADQFTNAAAVSETGIGTQLLAEQVTVDAVTESARRLLTEPAPKAAAAGVAAEIAAMPSPAEVAALLPELAEG